MSQRTVLPERSPLSRAPRRLTRSVLVLAVLLAAAAVRLIGVTRTQELFIDEVTYTDLTVSVATGEGVRLHGESFHLHPPGLFLLLAAVVRGLGLQTADLAALTYDLRAVPALFGSVTAAAVALLVLRAARSRRAAACAGALLAVEPFLVRFDGRVLLEAQAMGFAAVGMLGLVWLLDRQGRGDEAVWPAVLVGQLLVASLLTKETYASVAVLPVLVLLLTGTVLHRRTSATVLASTVSSYLLYVLVLAVNGEAGAWFAAKTVGVRRLLGITQLTGFNAEADGSASLVERVLAKLVDFALTYSLIGLGVLSALWLLLLLRRGAPLPDRPVVVLLVLWSACAQLHLAYAVTFGTLEEQMFYLLVVTAVAVLLVAAVLAVSETGPPLPFALERWAAAGHRQAGRHRSGRGTPHRRERTPRAAVRALLADGLAVALVAGSATWVRAHTVPDDAYARFLAWAEVALPRGSRVATTDETTQFVLEDTRVLRLETGAEARAFRAQYVVVVTELVEQGYSRVDADLLGLVRQGRLVFSASGRTVGELQVYDVSSVIGA